MVNSREELLSVADNNVKQLKANLSQSVQAFMDAQRTNPEELAYALGIDLEEMENVINGNGVITVDTLSKLLIATDMAVEIKPISMTPLHSYGRNMPKSGPLPPIGAVRPFGPARDGGARERIRREAEDAAKRATGPARDSHGRFVSRRRAEAPAPPMRHAPVGPRPSATTREENPYETMPTDGLVNIIRQNLWDSEIDVENSSRQQLIQFVMGKERLLRERTNGGTHTRPTTLEPEAHEPHAVDANGGSRSFNKFLDMLSKMAEEVKENPKLMETIERFMPNMD